MYIVQTYSCCKRALGRKSFAPFYTISVCFTDCTGETEGAIDAGGPTREMFRLVLQVIKDFKLFAGLDKQKYIAFHRMSYNKIIITLQHK